MSDELIINWPIVILVSVVGTYIVFAIDTIIKNTIRDNKKDQD